MYIRQTADAVVDILVSCSVRVTINPSGLAFLTSFHFINFLFLFMKLFLYNPKYLHVGINGLFSYNVISHKLVPI